MRILRASFLARRMGSAWLLLCCLAASVTITSALIAALVDFYSAALPGSVRQELTASGDLSVVVSGTTNDAMAASQTRTATAWMQSALGSVHYRLYRDVWSDDLNLPLPQQSGNVPVVQAAAMPDLAAFAVLTAGSWPASPQPGQPVPAALPASTAKLLDARVGSVFRLTDRSTGGAVTLRVTGLFQRRQLASTYWNADLIGPSGLTVAGGFASYGPAVVSPAAFGGANGSHVALAQGALSFVAAPSAASIAPADLASLSNRLSSAVASAQNAAAMSGLNVSTSLPALLANAARQLAAARLLVIISALQLLILAGAAIALAGRLLASHRDEECSVLAARGAARWQLVRPSLAEAALGCAAAAAVGAVAGGWLARLLERGSASSVATSAWPSLEAWLAAAVVFVFCLVIVLWPALRPAGIADVRVRRGRQALVAAAATAGLDVALVVLAVLCVRELRSYSAASAATTAGVDPVIAVAPALALAGLAVVALRLLPLAARGLERLTARGRRLGTAMANWEISRRPIRQSGPILLVILAVGAGTLALAQYQSWRQSVTDQANFAVGADVRVELAQPLGPSGAGRIAALPGVTAAMAVSETGYSSGQGVVMALTARQAAAAVLLRPDLSAVPAARLWQEITPAEAVGVAIPGRPAALVVTAAVMPGGAGRALGPISAQVVVQDASGATYTLPAGSMAADGSRHDLVAQIAPAGGADYPLRFLGLSLTYNWPPPCCQADTPATISITGLAEMATATGTAGRPFAAGRALAGFSVTLTATDLAFVSKVDGGATGVAPLELSWQGSGSTQQLVFDPGSQPHISPAVVRMYALQDQTAQVSILAADPLREIPAVATGSFLRANDLHVGSVTSVSVGSIVIPVRVVAAVSAFPTATGGGALIIDQAAIQDALASRGGLPLPVTGWWLRTVGDKAPAGLLAGLPAGTSVGTQAHAAAALRGEPLSAVPVQAAVAMSGAAALLAALGFCVSVAASARRRRSQRALLAALGVPATAQARQFCLEEFMVSLPAAAVGLAIGFLLAYLLIPAMTVSAAAGRPVPAVLVNVPLGWVLGLALVIPVLPVVAAAISAVRQPDPAAELRAAEAA